MVVQDGLIERDRFYLSEGWIAVGPNGAETVGESSSHVAEHGPSGSIGQADVVELDAPRAKAVDCLGDGERGVGREVGGVAPGLDVG